MFCARAKEYTEPTLAKANSLALFLGFDRLRVEQYGIFKSRHFFLFVDLEKGLVVDVLANLPPPAVIDPNLDEQV